MISLWAGRLRTPGLTPGSVKSLSSLPRIQTSSGIDPAAYPTGTDACYDGCEAASVAKLAACRVLRLRLCAAYLLSACVRFHGVVLNYAQRKLYILTFLFVLYTRDQKPTIRR